MLDMNPEVRTAWCQALRSEEYTQGRHRLRVHHSDGTYGYCCLGVLTDLAIKAGVLESWDVLSERGSMGTLSLEVREWAGLTGEFAYNPPIGSHSDGRQIFATGANDDLRWDFARIADAIDGGPEEASDAS